MSRALLLFGSAVLVASAAAVAQQAPAPAAGARPGQLTPAPEQDSTVIMYREVFAYSREGRRDPFAPLLSTADLRPVLHELTLTGVLVHPTRPIAIMRDRENTQYRVTTGMTVGRMRVVEIKPRTVVFAMTEYGYDRRDSLVLGDSASARP